MTKLKLGLLPDDKPVKVTLELPATLNRDLIDYAEVLTRETGQARHRSHQAHRAHVGAVRRHGSRIRKGSAINGIDDFSPADRKVENR